ncbi:MAG TPA: hypothetical protein VE913_10435 [Longimicrobium sp.]|nr:hypothetical protein [Longimicrobium sp.]
MYGSCIYCSGELGRNDQLPAFPIGKRVAFDAERGRLWAICPGCGRWNLAPIEERWEAVEEAERAFRDARLRAQSENIGMAKLPDGTRLIRVGRALPGELAAWRYGDQLLRRRRQYLVAAGAVAAGGIALAGGIVAIGVSGAIFSAFSGLHGAWNNHRMKKVVTTVDTGARRHLPLRRWHLNASVLRLDDGAARLHVPNAYSDEVPTGNWRGKISYQDSTLVLDPVETRLVLNRAMVVVNGAGASRRALDSATKLLAIAGTAEDYVRRTASSGLSLTKRDDRPDRFLGPDRALALEMALHEEQEWRAMEGELSALEAAWRDAEEIAAIADRLAADDALPP